MNGTLKRRLWAAFDAMARHPEWVDTGATVALCGTVGYIVVEALLTSRGLL